MSFCPKCGAAADATATFCATCGHALAPMAMPGMPGAPAAAARIPRPTGVSILAVLQFVGAGFLVLGALGLLLGGAAVRDAMMDAPSDAGVPAEMFTSGFLGFLAFLFLGFAVLCGFIGYGLWNGRPWARMLELVLAWIGLVGSVLGAFTSMGMPTILVGRIVGIGIYAFLIWYWTRPGVKAYFLQQA